MPQIVSAEDAAQAQSPSPPPRVSPTSLALMTVTLAATGVLDWMTGSRTSVLVLYAVVVAIAGWRTGRVGGLVAACLGGCAWLAAHFRLLDTTTMWNALVYLAVLAGVGYLAAVQRMLQLALQRAKTLAQIDPLTGVLNVGAFGEAARAEIARARSSAAPLAMAFLDLDRFKELNDSAGHAAGDEALRAVVRLIRQSVRAGDIIGRLGGDEFCILLPVTDLDAAHTSMTRVRQEVERFMRDKGWPVTTSIGLAAWRGDIPDLDDLLRVVDGLMYQAKHMGRNAICVPQDSPAGPSQPS